MQLSKIFDGIKTKNKYSDCDIKSLSRDSRTRNEGCAYFCFSKDADQSLRQCSQAFENGAKVIVSAFDLDLKNSIKVGDVRECFAVACANFYGRACDRLKIVGVTGTNGKTSICHITRQIMENAGCSVGVIGTSGVFFCGKEFACPLTTPDADFLHKTFRQMLDAGVEYVIMEVSAHAIDQKRVFGIKFEIGVLTNITQDHLDYFQTFENYEKCKLSFFDKHNMKTAIVCSDDESARKVTEKSDFPILSYAITNPADAFAIDICCSMNGTHFVANVLDCLLEVKTNLIGEYNVYNCLASLEICKCLGLEKEELEKGVSLLKPVEGRFNVVEVDGKFVVIDYAHSPDGIENILKTARELCDQKVFLIFGCGGNRDKTKRAIMGKIASENADFVCLTDDNPRFEKSLDIIADIESGMNKSHMVEPDRAKAIWKVLDIAREGDIILIAGKGAEKYQEKNGVKRHFSDFDVVKKYAKSKGEV